MSNQGEAAGGRQTSGIIAAVIGALLAALLISVGVQLAQPDAEQDQGDLVVYGETPAP